MGGLLGNVDATGGADRKVNHIWCSSPGITGMVSVVGGGLDAPAMPRVDLSNPVITHPVKLSTTAPTETSISALNDIYTPIGTPHHDVCIGLKPFNRTWRYLGAGARWTRRHAPARAREGEGVHGRPSGERRSGGWG